MPKQYSCCVPTCNTRGPLCSFLNFPSDPSKRQKWISAIPHLDIVINHKSLICQIHFKRGFLKQIDKGLVSTKSIPTIFKYDNDDISTKNYFPKYMFELLERDVAPETFGDIENEDYIVNFHFLGNNYHDKLGNLMDHWQVSITENYVFFYKLSLSHIAKIKCSVKINEKLRVEIAVSGRLMDPLDMTWILPPTSIITRWSQLKLLLFEFGVPLASRMLKK